MNGPNPLPELKYDISRRYPCPCRKGEWLYEAIGNDWGRRPKSERHTMLCTDCKAKYVYDRRLLGDRFWGGGIERGWTLREQIAVEQKYVEDLRAYQQSIVGEAEKRCRAIWQQRLAACRTKKAVYEVAARYGTYGTFLSHHRKETLTELIANLSAKQFYFSDIPQVLKACGIKEKPEQFTKLAKPKPPINMPEDLWQPHEEMGAGSGQARAGPPSLDGE